MIVVDTNVLASLLLPGPRTEQAEVLLLQQPQWAAPPLWRSEWRNVLTGYLRLDLLKLPAAIALMQQAEALLAAHDEPVASEQVLHLATSSGCSASPAAAATPSTPAASRSGCASSGARPRP